LSSKTFALHAGGGREFLGLVLKPVFGVGRLEGTKWAGRIRANHPGVICVSTSREGKVGDFK